MKSYYLKHNDRSFIFKRSVLEPSIPSNLKNIASRNTTVLQSIIVHHEGKIQNYVVILLHFPRHREQQDHVGHCGPAGDNYQTRPLRRQKGSLPENGVPSLG